MHHGAAKSELEAYNHQFMSLLAEIMDKTMNKCESKTCSNTMV